MKDKHNLWDIVAYVVGIGAIVFTIVMIIILALK